MLKVIAILSAFVLSAGLLLAQADPAKPTPAKSKATTVTGCLAKGDMAGQYAFTMKGGRKLTVSGAADLEKHVGHTVTLTGMRKGQNFDATSIKHVSPSCDMPSPPKK